jgi:hypothetical protein
MARGSQIWDRFETALAKKDYEGAVSMFVPDCVYIEPAGRHEGRAGVQAWLDEWGRGFAETNVKASLGRDYWDQLIGLVQLGLMPRG